MRRPVVAANWKMHKTPDESRRFLEEFCPLAAGWSGIEVVICPPFTALETAAGMMEGSPDKSAGRPSLSLGAQNMFWEERGAFTGEISPAMLTNLGCRYVILGHSERRQYFGETDEGVNRKVKAALAHGLIPIVCVGESLEERQRGETEAVVKRQISGSLGGLEPTRARGVVVAYEPVWAIGTGHAATGEDANRVSAFIRRVLADMYGPEVSGAVRIQYGGSVKPENIAEYSRQPEIDGALVGGASLDPHTFARIVEAFLDKRGEEHRWNS